MEVCKYNTPIDTPIAPESVDIKYCRALAKAIEKGQVYPTSLTEIKELPISDKKLWQKYRRLCWKITEKQPIKKLTNFDKRGFKGYHLDHKVSIWYGYKNKIDPKMIGSIHNLEFIPHYENGRKGIKCNFKDAKPFQLVIFI